MIHTEVASARSVTALRAPECLILVGISSKGTLYERRRIVELQLPRVESVAEVLESLCPAKNDCFELTGKLVSVLPATFVTPSTNTAYKRERQQGHEKDDESRLVEEHRPAGCGFGVFGSAGAALDVPHLPLLRSRASRAVSADSVADYCNRGSKTSQEPAEKGVPRSLCSRARLMQMRRRECVGACRERVRSSLSSSEPSGVCCTMTRLSERTRAPESERHTYYTVNVLERNVSTSVKRTSSINARVNSMSFSRSSSLADLLMRIASIIMTLDLDDFSSFSKLLP